VEDEMINEVLQDLWYACRVVHLYEPTLDGVNDQWLCDKVRSLRIESLNPEGVTHHACERITVE